jgi:hemerythrin
LRLACLPGSQATPSKDRFKMDMQPPVRGIETGFETRAREYVCLVEQRRRVFELIGDFRRAVSQPKGSIEALQILKAILPCSDAYFSQVEFLLDKISAAGAAPHRDGHRRILREMKETFDRCSSRGAIPTATELAHALDTLMIHEATICLRGSSTASRSR